MIASRNSRRRSGAAALETAIVIGVLLMLVIAIIAGGWRIFRYQQAAALAREGARWSSVRGGEYQRDTNLDSPTKQAIIDQAIRPYAAGIDPAALDVQVVVIDRATGAEKEWDSASKDVRSITSGGEYVSNTVRVTVSITGTMAFFGGTYTVQSRCEMPFSH